MSKIFPRAAGTGARASSRLGLQTVQCVVVVLASVLAVEPSIGQTPAASATTGPTVPDSGQTDFPVIIRLSESLLADLIYKDIQTQAPVDQMVLGVRAIGTAWTNGTLSLDLKPAARGVALNVCFEGTNVSETSGRNGPVILNNTATTRFSAIKPVRVELEQGLVDGEAEIAATTYVTTRSIRSTVPGLRGCLVRRMAANRLQQAYPQLTAIARHNATNRIRQAFDEGIKKLLARYNGDLDLIRPVILRYRKQDPNSSLVFSSTEDFLQLGFGRVDSPNLPELPETTVAPSPLQIWLHRSIFGRDGSPTPQQWSEIREAWREIEQLYDDRQVVVELPRGTPVILGMAGDWAVIGLGEEERLATAP